MTVEENSTPTPLLNNSRCVCNTEKVSFEQVHSGETSIETASLSSCREDIGDNRKSFDSFSSEPSNQLPGRTEDCPINTCSRAEVVVRTPNTLLEQGTISATHSPSLPTELDFPRSEDRKASVGPSAVEFGPCSQKSFHGASILLVAQQQLDINRKSREEALNRELRAEEHLKKEERIKLEQKLLAEAKENKRLLDLQRKQELEQQQTQQRINEERQRQLEEERRQQQILEQEKRQEEERQRREFIKRQELERSRKQQEEAELRKQKAIEDQIRRQKEEKIRLERQCEFPPSANIKPIHMPPANGNQHHHAGVVANGQQFYPYKDAKRQQQHQRSGTMSSNGETPLKFRSTRNHPHEGHLHNHREHLNAPDTPTLFFERIVNEEVAEIKSYTEIIQKQNSEIIELKNNNNEMEARLEFQTKDRIELESTIENQEIHWARKCEELQETVDAFKKSLETEKTTNKKLWDLVYVKEKEIKRAYSRKVSTKIVPVIFVFSHQLSLTIFVLPSI